MLNIKMICTVLFFVMLQTITAQRTTFNKYGLHVINNTILYKNDVRINKAMKMMRLKKRIPKLLLELHYATNDNFLHQQLYTTPADAYLRLPAAAALAGVQKELNDKGLGLKIFDAYRPYGITEKIWEAVKDERYAANPATGSGHNRGIAVDLTIIDLKTGKALNMGTGFDNFTDSAHHNFMHFPKEILDNRILLKSTMEKYGFIAFDTEWWHYSLPDPKKYALLNLDFSDFDK
jgi:D-alanyl-D-alanine dipeptidase